MKIEYPSLPVFCKDVQAGHYYSKSKSKYVKIEDMHISHLNNAIVAIENAANTFRPTVLAYNLALNTENPEELAKHISMITSSELALNLHPQYLALMTVKLNKDQQNQPHE
jgi:hypothetical protein